MKKRIYSRNWIAQSRKRQKIHRMIYQDKILNFNKTKITVFPSLSMLKNTAEFLIIKIIRGKSTISDFNSL